MSPSFFHRFCDLFTDALCIFSIVGIWARYVEPAWLDIRHEKAALSDEQKSPIRLAHLSDLHWNTLTNTKLLKTVLSALEKGRPDLILFTGDFLAYSKSCNMEELEKLLQSWQKIAPVVACLGNHDYNQYVTQRDGQVRIQIQPMPFLLRALKRLIMPRRFFNLGAHHGMKLVPQQCLIQSLEKAGIRVLINETAQYTIQNQTVKIVGLGDLWAEGSETWDALKSQSPHVLLMHNPDGLDKIEAFNKALVLCGHTHGGNINLSGIRAKMRSVSLVERLKGWQHQTKHLAYVNRGLGSPYPLRLFSRPELTWINLTL